MTFSFWHHQTVGSAIKLLNGIGLCPPIEECIIQITEHSAQLLVGYKDKITQKETWIFATGPVRLSKRSNTKAVDFKNARYKTYRYLAYSMPQVPLQNQVNYIKAKLADFMGYDVDNRILMEHSRILPAFDVDLSKSAWVEEDALSVLQKGTPYSEARHGVLQNIFANNFNDPHRAAQLLIDGIDINYIKELWDLPNSWIKESDKGAIPLLVLNPSQLLFNSMFNNSQPRTYIK